MILKPQPGTVLLDSNSSLVSGLSALIFDILLLNVMNAGAQSLSSIMNLYLLYGKRQPISPTTSRLGLLWGSPVGSIRLARCLSLLIAFSTACVFTISFAITGKTVSQYERVRYHSLVHITDTPAQINYSEEFKEFKNSDNELRPLVSRRLLAMSYAYHCIRNNYTHFNIYGHAYRGTVLDKSLVDMKSRIEGAQCITEEHFSETHLVRSHPVEVLFVGIKCVIGNIPVQPSRERKIKSVEVTPESCDMNITRLQCYGDVRMSCAAVGFGKGERKNILFALKVQDYKQPANFFAIAVPNGEQLADETKYDHFAANIAFFVRAGFGGSLNHIGLMALSNVTHNIELERRGQEVQATEIDLHVALPTILLVLAAMILLGLTTVFLWMRVVYMKRRWGYNFFATVPEALELLNPEGPSRFRGRFGKQRWIGIRKDTPVISEGEAAEVSGGTWEESEVR